MINRRDVIVASRHDAVDQKRLHVGLDGFQNGAICCQEESGSSDSVAPAGLG
jgi:hypothetical protein